MRAISKLIMLELVHIIMIYQTILITSVVPILVELQCYMCISVVLVNYNYN